MRCSGCDYALDHLPSKRCPECGREFDPQDPTSFNDPLAPRKRVVSSWWFLGAALVWTQVVPAIVRLIDWPGVRTPWTNTTTYRHIGALIAISALCAYALGVTKPRGPAIAAAIVAGWGYLMLLLLILFVVISGRSPIPF